MTLQASANVGEDLGADLKRLGISGERALAALDQLGILRPGGVGLELGDLGGGRRAHQTKFGPERRRGQASGGLAAAGTLSAGHEWRHTVIHTRQIPQVAQRLKIPGPHGRASSSLACSTKESQGYGRTRRRVSNPRPCHPRQLREACPAKGTNCPGLRALLPILVLLAACDTADVNANPPPDCELAITNPAATPPVGAGEAVRLVWYGRFQGEGQPPTVTWYSGECLETGEPGCLRGRTCGASVAVAKRDPLPSHTSLVHELLHVYLERRDGDVDATHAGDDWAIVDPVSRWLATEGL